MNTVEKYKNFVITSMVDRIQPVVIERARGAEILDYEGKTYIDCFSGISVVNAGHNAEKVMAAAKAQIDQFIHCASYIYYSKPTADLAEKLAGISPGRLKKTFFGNSGAEAIEGSLRLAKAFTGKSEFIALQASFHGRTYATLSVTGNCARKRRGAPFMPGCAFLPAPYCYRCFYELEYPSCRLRCARALEDIIRFDTADHVAAFVAEPLMGEGGIITPPDEFFLEVEKILKRHAILFIDDEVQSGFARTGKMFAIEHYGVEPDIMAVAKGIADGFPLGGFIAREEIADSFRPGDHLTTFGGNPVSCAAGLANITVLEEQKLADAAAAKGDLVMSLLQPFKKRHQMIGEIRGKGLMIGIELVRDAKKTPAASEAGKIRDFCLANGVLVGAGGVYGNVIRIQPPLVISETQIGEALNILDAAFKKIVPAQ